MRQTVAPQRGAWIIEASNYEYFVGRLLEVCARARLVPRNTSNKTCSGTKYVMIRRASFQQVNLPGVAPPQFACWVVENEEGWREGGREECRRVVETATNKSTDGRRRKLKIDDRYRCQPHPDSRKKRNANILHLQYSRTRSIF